jgi:hypothetical protein
VEPPPGGRPMTAIARSLGAGRKTRTVVLSAIFVAFLGLLGYGAYGLWANSHHSYLSGNPAKWLPKQQLNRPVDRTLVGTYASPAITLAGDDVRVETRTFTALAVVTGPAVPGEGLSYQPNYITSTWTVHIFDVKGYIPLSTKDFDSIDHLDREYQLHVPQGATMPASVSTGQQATFQLRAVVPTGESLFRWAPNGNNIVAKWSNQVEND